MTDHTGNRVLDSMPPAVRQKVLERSRRVDHAAGTTLVRAGSVVSAVQFPTTVVISTVSTYSDGSIIEMANIGRESCTGTGLTLDQPRALNTNIVQLAGASHEIGAADFLRLKAEHSELRGALLSSVQALIYQIMISGACNGVHSARQRLSRWLLTMHDRNDDGVMELTQDFLAEMLGVRRATVSEAAGSLREAGLISYSRGRVRVEDYDGLRAASCECYDLVREAHDTLLPLRN